MEALRCGRVSRVILRDMTEADLDVLFDIQDDDVAQHMAAFTTSDSGQRDSYVAKWRKILAKDEITKKVILVNDEILASAALAELLREVTVRPLFARAAADNAGSERVLLRNGFTRVGEETSYAEARATEITEYIYRLDEPPTTG